MVECVRHEPGKTIADSACGTGGFFLAAHDFLTDPENHALDKDQKAFLNNATFFGNEIVAGTRRKRIGADRCPVRISSRSARFVVDGSDSLA
jgi:type I restriction-modification system DNA methylase subunit